MTLPLALLLVLAATGCSDNSPGEDEADALRTATRAARLTATAAAPTATATLTPTATPTPDPNTTDADEDGVVDALDFCPDEPESPIDGEPSNWDDDSDGCPDAIEDLILLGATDVEFYWINVFDESDLEYLGPSDFVPYDEPIATPCGDALLNNAFYCSIDGAIYFDILLFQEELETNGDFGPVFIIAHEWAHLVQDQLGRLGDRPTIDSELEADCLAGSYASDAESRGVLDDDDLREARESLFRVGDPIDFPYFDPTAHGSPGQRIDAFNAGYQLGPAECLDRYAGFSGLDGSSD